MSSLKSFRSWLSATMVFAAASCFADDWPAFRGPQGDGVASTANPPVEWSRDRHVKWRAQLPGPGNGSPIVVGGRVFLTVAADLGRRRTLYCFDRRDGRELWNQSVAVNQIELTHTDNPDAGTTPASDGNVVVVWHATGGLHAYSMNGERLWSRDFGEIKHLWGYGPSPIIHEDRVILYSGATRDMFVAAVGLRDGTLLWKAQEPGGETNETPDGELTGSWATPVVVRVNGRPQIVCSMPTRVVAYAPADGSILWTCDGLSSERGRLVYASPSVAGDLIVAMAGYMGPSLAVRASGAGDVTGTHRLWHVTERIPQRIGSGVTIGESLYVANADGGTIQCLDLQTGRERWRQRVAGGPHWASLVFAGGLCFATNQSGTTRVFRPDPQRFDLVAENALEETINATPAFSGGEVFLRTDRHLYCIARPE